MTTHENGSAGLGGHHQHLGGGDARALKITAWLTGIYFVVELAIGIWTGSVSVLSDAMHTFSAVGGIVLAIIASRIAARPADTTNTFGRRRAEIIGALLNGFFLLGMAALVIFMGSMRLQDPKELETGPMLGAAIGGLSVEFVSLYLLWSGQKGNLNIRGAYWHVLQTFVGSLIIIVAAVVIQFTDFLEIDPILGIAFGLVLLYASWGIIKQALTVLMETVPDEIDVSNVRNQLRQIPGVKNVHHIHAWSLTTGKNNFSTHVLVDSDIASQKVLEQSYEVIEAHGGIGFATVQVENEYVDLAGSEDIDITGEHRVSETQDQSGASAAHSREDHGPRPDA